MKSTLIILIAVFCCAAAVDPKKPADHKVPAEGKDAPEDPDLLEFAHDDPHGTDHGDLHTQLFLGATNPRLPFEHLSEPQKVEKVKKLFEHIDESKDKVLDYGEVKNWITNSMRKIDYESAAASIGNDDGDGDNKVSWLELLQIRHKFNAKQLEELHQQKLKDAEIRGLVEHIEDEKRMFERADQNKDGFLDVKEYAAFSAPWRFSHMLGYEVDDVMAKADANKDHFIDLQEYLKYKKALGKEMVDRMTHRFHVLDRNYDYKLSHEELLHVLQTALDRRATQETKHIMREMDADHDGHLDLKEVLRRMHDILHTDHEEKHDEL